MNENDIKFQQVMAIYPLVRNAVNLTDDPVVFGTVLTSVIQLWASDRGIDPIDVVSDMTQILARYDEENCEEEK